MRFTSLALLASMATTILSSPVAEVDKRLEFDFVEPPLAEDQSIGSVLANASDIAARSIDKRAPESVHIGICAGSRPQSFVVYCPDDPFCNRPPSSGNVVYMDGVRTLEGGTYGVTFPTGVVFEWSFPATAGQLPAYQYAGPSRNTYRSFACWRDDWHIMFNDARGNRCQSIYYCL